MALSRDYAGPWYVYKLIDPRTALPFYVGLSIDPERRLYGHMSKDSACRGRLREIKQLGLVCRVEIVSEHWTIGSGHVAEQDLIAALPGLVNRARHKPFWPGCARGEPPVRDWLYV